MNTGERDQALYLDDDFEKQTKIEDLEVHLWKELFEDHVLEDLLRQGGEGTIVSFLRGGDTVNTGPDAEFDSIMNGNRGPEILVIYRFIFRTLSVHSNNLKICNHYSVVLRSGLLEKEKRKNCPLDSVQDSVRAWTPLVGISN